MDARSRCSQAYGRKLKIAVKLQRQPCAFCFCIDTRNKLARRSAISLLLFLLFVVALLKRAPFSFHCVPLGNKVEETDELRC